MHLEIKIALIYIKCLATENWVDVAPERPKFSTDVG